MIIDRIVYDSYGFPVTFSIGLYFDDMVDYRWALRYNIDILLFATTYEDFSDYYRLQNGKLL